jgi:hypothetical protein
MMFGPKIGNVIGFKIADFENRASSRNAFSTSAWRSSTRPVAEPKRSRTTPFPSRRRASLVAGELLVVIIDVVVYPGRRHGVHRAVPRSSFPSSLEARSPVADEF